MQKVTFPERFDAKIESERDIAVLPGRDEKGDAVVVELPLSTLVWLAAQGRRAAAVRSRLSQGPLEQRGANWGEIVPLVFQTCLVGSLVLQNKPTVALVFDKGLSTEMVFPFGPEQAVELAGRLKDESERCKTLDPKTSN